ncbi:MAG: ParA family protein [Dehalococcoidia bacterium]
MLNKIIAIANQNGGVGKTTTTMNLGAALQESGFKILLVDLDPQATLTIAHGFNPDDVSLTIYDALRKGNEDMSNFDIKQAVVHSQNGVDIMPANLDLAAAEVELHTELGREYFVKNALSELKTVYDIILIDCAPTLGHLTINALTAAEGVIIPVTTQYLRFRGLKLLLETIKKVKTRNLNPTLPPPRILPSMFQANTIHSKEVLDELRDTFGTQVFQTVVRHTIRLAEAPISGQSILQYQPGSPYAQAYRELAQEVKEWLQNQIDNR